MHCWLYELLGQFNSSHVAGGGKISSFSRELIRRFKKKRPVALLARMSLTRLLSEDALDRVFEEHGKTQYTRKILFSSLTHLMADVTLCLSRSVNAAYKKHRKELSASRTAVSNKINRVEPQVSQELVRHCYAEAASICNHLRSGDSPYISGYRTKILDGNHLSGTEHRLAAIRAERAAALPGKSLVVLDPRLRLIQDFFPIEDAHHQERTALVDVIKTIRSNDLWIADRNFCTLKFMVALDLGKAAFVIRHHGRVGCTEGKRRRVGKSATGIVYESTVKLSSYEGTQLKLRRIEIELFKPTRDGEKVVVILTNVPKERAKAVEIADIYLQRWKIETAFQVLTTTLRCEVNTLGYPNAALFAFATALLAYNAVVLIEAVARAEHGKREADNLSKYYMAMEITEASDTLSALLDEGDFAYLKDLSIADFAAEMRDVASHIDLSYYRKTTRGPKKPVKKKPPSKSNVHVSTARILAQQQE